ncbi:MAG TPA: hypothetical protein PKN47_22255 [Nitrospira sp.]|nr:hypothetical protein [Nitrospira sp.]
MSLKSFGIAVLLTVMAATAVVAMEQVNGDQTYSWRYKMTVEVETPEGIKTGSAVRQMGNELQGSPLSQGGNPADVRGEAVVVDLGKRGVLFALISSDSDLEFYNAFPVPGNPVGNGGSTPEGIQYYANLSVGTQGILNPKAPPGYPQLVTFKDLNDPKSVTLVQEWTYIRGQERGQNFELTKDHMEELFGPGVKLKSITLEITDEPVTWGIVNRYMPKKFKSEIIDKWKDLPYLEKERIYQLISFKQGDTK